MRQTVASLDAKEYRTAFEQLRRLRLSFPDYAGLEEIRNRVASLSADVWNGLARQDAERAAPDDPGFAEMWLVVARVDEIRGRVAESRDSIRQAWEAVERMTTPERAVESGIDLTTTRDSNPIRPESPSDLPP
jgi:hypothetical protein